MINLEEKSKQSERMYQTEDVRYVRLHNLGGLMHDLLEALKRDRPVEYRTYVLNFLKSRLPKATNVTPVDPRGNQGSSKAVQDLLRRLAGPPKKNPGVILDQPLQRDLPSTRRKFIPPLDTAPQDRLTSLCQSLPPSKIAEATALINKLLQVEETGGGQGELFPIMTASEQHPTGEEKLNIQEGGEMNNMRSSPSLKLYEPIIPSSHHFQPVRDPIPETIEPTLTEKPESSSSSQTLDPLPPPFTRQACVLTPDEEFEKEFLVDTKNKPRSGSGEGQLSSSGGSDAIPSTTGILRTSSIKKLQERLRPESIKTGSIKAQKSVFHQSSGSLSPRANFSPRGNARPSPRFRHSPKGSIRTQTAMELNGVPVLPEGEVIYPIVVGGTQMIIRFPMEPIDICDVAVFGMREDGTILHWNACMARTTSYMAFEVCGASVYSLLADEASQQTIHGMVIKALEDFPVNFDPISTKPVTLFFSKKDSSKKIELAMYAVTSRVGNQELGVDSPEIVLCVGQELRSYNGQGITSWLPYQLQTPLASFVNSLENIDVSTEKNRKELEHIRGESKKLLRQLDVLTSSRKEHNAEICEVVDISLALGEVTTGLAMLSHTRNVKVTSVISSRVLFFLVNF